MSADTRVSEVHAALLAIPKLGAGVGLHRVKALLEDLRSSRWMAELDAIKVTGSNGKGSVCAMTAAILDALGLFTGRYTSPHLFAFNERIVVGGEPISEERLAHWYGWFEERARGYRAANPGDDFGAFEVFTAIAMQHFSRKKPSALVVEAGIGGRYDATRAIPGNVVALTSVDLEHTALLGETEELIAYDKANLCPDRGVLVAGGIAPELERRLAGYCAVRRIEVVSAEQRSRVHSVRFEPSCMIADIEVDGQRWQDLRIALVGHHQIMNAVVSILLVRTWALRNLPALEASELERAVREGLASVRWPGRFERVHESPEVIVDVGHSPGAIDALVGTVRSALAGRKVLLVTGVSYDKAVEPIVQRLAVVADEVICTRAHHKGADVASIERIARAAAPGLPVSSAATIEEAMALAMRRAAEAGMTVLVAGGLFLAIEGAHAARGHDPRALRFL